MDRFPSIIQAVVISDEFRRSGRGGRKKKKKKKKGVELDEEGVARQVRHGRQMRVK